MDSLIFQNAVYQSEVHQMKKSTPESLINRMINNEITRLEFDEFIHNMEDTETKDQYEKALRAHYDKIMKDHEDYIKRK